MISLEQGKKEAGERPARVRRRKIRFLSQQNFRKILKIIGTAEKMR
jgi:hypothetical protein